MENNDLLNEILEQPEALRRLHAAYVAGNQPALSEAAELLKRSRTIFMAGMATSEYAAIPASCLLSQHGRVNFVYDASELLYYHRGALNPDSSLMLVSQSGDSAEIIHLLDELHGRIPILGVYNSEDSTLAKQATIGLPMFSGPQLACGSKTNLSSIALLLLLVEKVLGHDLKEAGAALLSAADSIERSLDGWEGRLSPVVDFLEKSAYTVFLGRGPSRASALFTSVLFREVPKMVAEGMGAATFRHGLREMIHPAHRVVIFAPQGSTHSRLLQLARDVADVDVPVLLISNADDLPESSEKFLTIRTAPQPELWSPLVDMVPLQLVGYLLAKRRGYEPGKLIISTYVTTVE
jgi:glucosamine--fructose-6-phosphate aminotransferase (isomerizing)